MARMSPMSELKAGAVGVGRACVRVCVGGHVKKKGGGGCNKCKLGHNALAGLEAYNSSSVAIKNAAY